MHNFKYILGLLSLLCVSSYAVAEERIEDRTTSISTSQSSSRTISDLNGLIITDVYIQVRSSQGGAFISCIAYGEDGTTVIAQHRDAHYPSAWQPNNDGWLPVPMLVANTTQSQITIKVASSSGTINWSSTKIIYTDPNALQPTTLSFAENMVVKNISDQAFSNTLSGIPSGANTEYISDDTDVATIDGAGLVTIVGTGFATIQAATSATSTYAAGEATYDLIVTPNNASIMTFETDNDAIWTKAGLATHTENKHSGKQCGKASGTSAQRVTSTQLQGVKRISFYASKTTAGNGSANWVLKYDSTGVNGTWTDVATFSAESMSIGEWMKYQYTFPKPFSGYLRIDYISESSGAHCLIDDIIVEHYATETVTIGSALYTTFCPRTNVAISVDHQNELKAYYVSAWTANSLSLTEVSDHLLTAGQGYLLKREVAEGETVTSKSFTLMETLTSPAGISNKLIGTSENITLQQDEAFVLARKSDTGIVGFYPCGNISLSAGKAYLSISQWQNETASPQAPESMRMIFLDAEANGEHVATQLEHTSEAHYPHGIYTIMGQPISAATAPGMYIINGRLTIIK